MDLDVIKVHLAAFADAVGLPLADWQARALRLERRVSVIVAPRQSGKSRSLAVLALWSAFRKAGQRVLIVSAGEEASRRLLRTVRDVAGSSPLLSASVVDEQAGLLTLSNGSEVRSVPASERQVRGWSVDLLLADEAALIADDLLLGAALPTTAARPDARIVLAGSATVASGAFFDFARNGESGSEHVRSFRWALADCSWISPSTIEAARESMSEARFAAEYLGEFASGADSVFTRAVLDRATADYLPVPLAGLQGPARVLAGCDWGATTDRSALVAVARLAVPERVFAVCCAHRWRAGEPLPDVVEEIAASPAHFDTLVSESNGLGAPVTQLLWRALARRAPVAGGARPRGPVLVDPYRTGSRAPQPRDRDAFTTRKLAHNTTSESKAASFSALRLMLEQGSLVLPASAEDLRRELLMLRVNLTPMGTERIEAGAGHDDLALALSMAAVPYRPRSGSWRVLLAELANPRRPLPEPVVRASGETVSTGTGMAVPRLPAWVSVAGPEVTLPPRAPTREPAHIRRAREAVRKVLSTNERRP